MKKVNTVKDHFKHRFSVVVDAGSTGCRVYAYEVTSDGDVSTSKGPKATPGLSSLLAASFEEVEAYLAPLVDFALSAVPEEAREQTSFRILATAGMRLLKDDEAERLYERVYAAVKRKGLKVRRSEVRTISGEDEAYYAALAVNYALGLADASKKRAVEESNMSAKIAALAGVLDLGGASTQIAVPVISSHGTEVVSAADFRVRSYLGFGVEVFAKRFLGDADRKRKCEHEDRLASRFDDCALAIATFLGVEACDRRKNSSVIITQTRPSCEPLLLPTTPRSQVTIAAAESRRFGSGKIISPSTKFVATSLYYYAWRSLTQMLRVAGNNSVADAIDKDWPRPSLEAIRSAARVACGKSMENILNIAAVDGLNIWDNFLGDADRRREELPRRCFDLAYVDVLLSGVFGFADRQITVAVALGDVDLDWTLGVVLDDAGDVAIAKRKNQNVYDVVDEPAAFAMGAISLLACAGLFLLAVCFRLLRPNAKVKCDVDPFSRRRTSFSSSSLSNSNLADDYNSDQDQADHLLQQQGLRDSSSSRKNKRATWAKPLTTVLPSNTSRESSLNSNGA